MFRICLARRAKPSVPCVSWKQLLAGEMLAITTVRALPPRESCSPAQESPLYKLLGGRALQ